MTYWTDERILRQYERFERDGGGIPVRLFGGPYDGATRRAPHLAWCLWLVVDDAGEERRLPYPPDVPPELYPGDKILGVYLFDRDHECFQWVAP